MEIKRVARRKYRNSSTSDNGFASKLIFIIPKY